MGWEREGKVMWWDTAGGARAAGGTMSSGVEPWWAPMGAAALTTLSETSDCGV